jgi:hypothetical protein
MTQAQLIAARRREIDAALYDFWLLRMGYKRVPWFWERAR